MALTRNIVLSTVVLMGVLTNQVMASCYKGDLKTGVGDGGKENKFCEYKDGDKKNLTMSLGTTITTKDCFKCTCSSKGLSCCGVGPAAGMAQYPTHCKEIVKGCTVSIVMKDDESKPCITGNPSVKP